VFEETDYEGATFAGLRAASTEVADVRFTACAFERSDLSDAVFASCVFDDCSFTDCTMALFGVMNSRFSAVRFHDCKLTGVNWSDADCPTVSLVEPFQFLDCLLDHSVFLGVTLDRVGFLNCSLREVDFSEASLRDAVFSGSDLSGARFSRSDLRGARLESAHGYGIDSNDNLVTGMVVSLPEAVSLISSIGVELVELPL
jgi:uncharacterized protein YjbI with pentapeptide repeats